MAKRSSGSLPRSQTSGTGPIVEQTPRAIFQGGGLRSTTFVMIYIKMFVLACNFQIKRLPPWQTWRNSSIKYGIQDGRQLLKWPLE